MIDKNFIIPSVYEKMNNRGFTDMTNYLWLNDMEWTSIDKIKEYEYDEGESNLIVPFAITAGGDKWVWVSDEKCDEKRVGLCEHVELYGVYYAKNTEDAILRHIIEYVADMNFYINEEDAESFQVSEEELKMQLVGWKNNFTGILKDEYISIIDDLSKLSLKHVKSQYGEWYALLSLEEHDKLVYEYFNFDLMDKEFEWYTNLD